MKRFEHGGNIYQVATALGITSEVLVDFSANINPLVSPKQLQAWADGSWSQVLHYPDPAYLELRASLATYHAVDMRTVVVDNGATPLIAAIVEQHQPKRATLLAPTFGEYEKALLNAGSTINFVQCDSDYGFDVLALEQAAHASDMLFICSPNNPTGLTIEASDLTTLVDALPHCLCVIDESFIDFCDEATSSSMISQIANYSNLVILRSATKFYGLPGLRLGYIITGNQPLVASLNRALSTWRVNVIASTIVMRAIADRPFANKTRRYIETARHSLKTGLEQLGFKVVDGKANYLLIESPYVLNLYDALLARRIVIRRCVNYRGLSDRHYRIAVKSANDNQYLLNALTNLLGSHHD